MEGVPAGLSDAKVNIIVYTAGLSDTKVKTICLLENILVIIFFFFFYLYSFPIFNFLTLHYMLRNIIKNSFSTIEHNYPDFQVNLETRSNMDTRLGLDLQMTDTYNLV